MKLITILFFLASCSGISMNFGEDYNDLTEANNQITPLIENMKIDEALSVFEKLASNGKDWCLVKYPSRDACARKSEEVPTLLVLKIKKIEDCQPYISECKLNELRKNDLKQCISRIKKYCPLRSRDDTMYPNEFNKFVSTLETKMKSADWGSSKMSATDKKRADKCKAETKWSYYTAGWINKSTVFHARTIGKKTGAFETKDACEKERISSPIEIRKGVEFDHCRYIYHGKDNAFCERL